MATRRRYTKRDKMSAVLAAEASSTIAAAESTGIPRKTIAYWLEQPEFAALRQKSAEERGEAYRLASTLALGRLIEMIPEMEARDLITFMGVATDKGQLLAGQATERTETRDLSFPDHEADILGEVVRAELARRTDERAAGDAVERAGTTGAATPAG